MPKPHYLPTKDQDRAVWLNNFAAKLPGYQAAFHLTATEVAAVQADAAAWQWLVGWVEALRTRTQQLVAYKAQLRDGPAGPATPPPGPPEFDPPAATAAADIFGRVGALVQRLKNHPAYTEAVGQDLGIVTPAAPAPDPARARPELTLSLAQGGQVLVGWKRQGMDALRIEVDRGQGWQFLAVDTVPDYLDTAPLPPPGQSAVWKYRAIYLLDDQPAGQWSDPASIAVMGG
jgi:ribosome modulation factor